MSLENNYVTVNDDTSVTIDLTDQQAVALATQLGRVGGIVGTRDQMDETITFEQFAPIYDLWDELSDAGFDTRWNDYEQGAGIASLIRVLRSIEGIEGIEGDEADQA